MLVIIWALYFNPQKGWRYTHIGYLDGTAEERHPSIILRRFWQYLVIPSFHSKSRLPLHQPTPRPHLTPQRLNEFLNLRGLCLNVIESTEGKDGFL